MARVLLRIAERWHDRSSLGYAPIGAMTVESSNEARLRMSAPQQAVDLFTEYALYVWEQWACYKELHQAESLNKAAPSTVSLLAHVSGQFVMLRIRALADPGRNRFTPREIAKGHNIPIKDELSKAIVRFEDCARPLKVHRDNRIAHINIKYALGRKPLDPVTERQVAEAVNALWEAAQALRVAVGLELCAGLIRNDTVWALDELCRPGSH